MFYQMFFLILIGGMSEYFWIILLSPRPHRNDAEDPEIISYKQIIHICNFRS